MLVFPDEQKVKKLTLDDIFVTSRSYKSVKQDMSVFIKDTEFLFIGDEHYHANIGRNNYFECVKQLKLLLLEDGYIGMSDVNTTPDTNIDDGKGGYFITGVAIKSTIKRKDSY
jgi:hypothetical protein